MHIDTRIISDNPLHSIIIAPRGAGKTHLIESRTMHLIRESYMGRLHGDIMIVADRHVKLKNIFENIHHRISRAWSNRYDQIVSYFDAHRGLSRGIYIKWKRTPERYMWFDDPNEDEENLSDRNTNLKINFASKMPDLVSRDWRGALLVDDAFCPMTAKFISEYRDSLLSHVSSDTIVMLTGTPNNPIAARLITEQFIDLMDWQVYKFKYNARPDEVVHNLDDVCLRYVRHIERGNAISLIGDNNDYYEHFEVA